MNDEQLIAALRRLDRPVSPDPAFAEGLFVELQRRKRSPRAPRPGLLLVAAMLTTAALGTALAVGSGTSPPRIPAAADRLEQRPVAGSIAVWGEGQGGDEIRIIDPDGTGQTVFASTGHDSYPVWSPDGTRIAYTAHDNRGPVRVVNADGTGARSITEGYASPVAVAWSPDGRQIAFVGYRYPGGRDRGLYVVNADGTGLVRLGGPEGELSRLAWSPDGSLISVVAVRPGTGAGDFEAMLHVVDPRTGAVARVSDSPLVSEGDYAAPSWSPDSSRLLYAVARSRDRTASGIAVAERGPAGWTERMVVTDPVFSGDISPLWLDADRFVFLRSWTRLVVANADGSGQRELARADARTAPCVAPDGSRVAVALDQADGAVRGELLIVAIDAAIPPRRIPTGDIWGQGPGCSWQAVKP